MKWSGVLFKVGKPSSKNVGGGMGHAILLLHSAIQDCLLQLPGKPLWNKHITNPANQIGIIESADIIDGNVVLAGELFDRPLNLAASTEPMGLSYDAKECHVLDMRAKIFQISTGTFIGVSLVPLYNAAHKDVTSFQINP